MNMKNMKIPNVPSGGAASALLKLGVIGGIGLYAAANSLYNVEGGHRAIVFNRLVGVKDEDVGQSILESYSRVMESLALNIMAMIDDVLYVDDSIKRCAAADSLSLFSRKGFGGMPIQKRLSPSPFSIQHTPYASPFATPMFCSSFPFTGSPCSPTRIHDMKRNGPKEGAANSKAEKLAKSEFERLRKIVVEV